MKADLKLDWCSYEAMLFACQNFHYSRSIPGADSIKIGVWEDGQFIGCIVFSRGANKNIGSPYGLKPNQACELTRVALKPHKSPVTRMISIALKMVKQLCPGMELCISYADSAQGHHGGIYQGGNWIYVGDSVDSSLAINKDPLHRRSAYSRYGTSSLDKLKQMHPDLDIESVKMQPKHKYIYPLTNACRDRIKPLARPYPAATKADHPDQG